MVAQVTEAIALLQDAIGIPTADPATVAELEAENSQLKDQVGALELRITEFEAKQSLMREALGL